MSQWSHNGLVVATLNLPFCIQGSDKFVSLELTSATALVNAFLYTTSEFVGIVRAKLEDGDYQPVGVYSETPSCYLGNLLAATPYQIDLAIKFTAGFTGEQVIPIGIGYGNNVIAFSPEGVEITFGNVGDSEFSWYSQEGSLYFGEAS